MYLHQMLYLKLSSVHFQCVNERATHQGLKLALANSQNASENKKLPVQSASIFCELKKIIVNNQFWQI